ncbi:hypothetical protein KI387_032061, partial [Taxus chinensis]
DLKAFKPKDMQHSIPFKPGIKPFKLNEDRLVVADKIFVHQQKVKALFDKKA